MIQQIGRQRIHLPAFLLLILATTIFSGVLIWLFQGHDGPIVPDEIGYLAIANYILNSEILNVSAIPTYRFGQAILLLPSFAFGDSQAEAYRIGSAISCIQAALVPIVLIGIAWKLGFEISKRAVIAAFVVTLFPNYFYHASLVWPEASFRLFFLAAIYFVAWAWESKQSKLWVLASLVVVWLYALHPRSLGVVPVAAVLVFVACSRGGVNKIVAGLSISILMAGVLLVNHFQQHFVDILWPGKGSDVSVIRTLIAMIFSGETILRVLSVSSGQAWALIVSSFGLYVVGLIYSAQLVISQPSLRPPIIFALGASAAIFIASVVQMAAYLTRIDHVIYGRYNDGANIFFVWLGLLYVLEAKPLRQVAYLVVGLAVGFGALTALFSSGFPVATIIDPNVASLIWVGRLIHFSEITLDELLFIGTLSTSAFIVSLWLMPSKTRVALVIAAISVCSYYAYYAKEGWHRGRGSMVEANASSYLPYLGSLYWDISARYNDNVVFDQYMAVEDPIPWSDISVSHIPYGSATIVASDLKVHGYSCAAQLSHGLVLLVRGPAPTHCGGMETPPVQLAFSAPLQLGGADAVRGVGWSRGEPWGRWTEARIASLHFILPEMVRDVVLEIDVMAYLGGELPRQRVAVRVNSQAQPDWVFTREIPRQIARIPVPDGATELEIEFEMPDARSPRQAGESDDGRKLGIGVSAVCLTHTDETCLAN